MMPHLTSEVPAPFEAYSGDGPYIFISYAHADKIAVFPAMRELHQKGANIWYDEGIQPAGEWSEEIAHHIQSNKCVLFVLFVTPRSIASKHVRGEINYAITENKDILTLYVEDTVLPKGMALNLGIFQSLSLKEDSWKEKAWKAISNRIGSATFDSAQVEVKERIKEIDHGEILWKSWEKARGQQISRFNSKKGLSVNPGRSISISEESVSQSQVSSESIMRHPTATHVEVSQPPPAAPPSPVEEIKDNFSDPTIGEMSWVRHGEITITEPYSHDQKVVQVKNGFWMSRFLITQESYEMVMGENPSFFNVELGRHEANLPVNQVSWLDAVSFCKALTILSKHGGTLPDKYEFRLPTEVEWEYACRAGTLTRYYFGDNPLELEEHAWFKRNSLGRAHPVGKKMPNPWGLFDMYGNVREWVGVSFQNTLLNTNAQDEFRISRGGAYMKPAEECESGSRTTNSLNHRYRNLGFRPVLAKVLR
jgi:formylglycine-generating enzyme required for sulfatase activity